MHTEKRGLMPPANRRDTMPPELKLREIAESLSDLMIFNERKDRQPMPRSRAEKIALEQDLIEDLRALRQQVGKAKDGGEPNFFAALRAHENSNDLWRGQFVAYLRQEARARYGKTVADLDREEWHILYGQFPQKENLEREEASVIDDYKYAAKEWWQLRGADAYDARLLRNDLLYRQATRVENKAERKDAQDQAMKDLKQLIAELKISKSTEEEAKKNFGRGAECELIYLIRHRLRRSGQDHVASIEHSLPLDDRKFKIDLVVLLGTEQHKLDQKTFALDDYQTKWQENKLIIAEENVGRSGGYLFRVNPADIEAAFAAAVADKRQPPKAETTIIKQIADKMPPALASLFTKSIEKKPIVRERTARINKRDIIQLLGDIEFLSAAGWLPAEDRNNFQLIVAWREKILPIVQKIVQRMIRDKQIKKLDELRASTELQEQIRRAITDSPAQN